MFTTGSKLFLGATVLSIVAAIVFGAVEGRCRRLARRDGAARPRRLAFAFMFGINYYTHDGNVSAMSEQRHDGSACRSAARRAQHVAGRSRPSAVGAIAVGAVSKPIVFKAGVVLVAGRGGRVDGPAAGASGASADAAYNASLRKRMLHPIEFPVLAAVGLAVVIYSFSR